MIGYLEGKIIAHDERSVILQNSAIGWRVLLGPQCLERAIAEGTGTFFTRVYSRENAQDLYGFPRFEELRFAELLMEVSGIGPRHAQLIVDSMPIETLAAAIAGGTSEPFERISGIGTKIAKKIIIELQPKLKKLGIAAGALDPKAFAEEDDALEALQSLGYKRREAIDALKRVPKDTTGVTRRVEEALKLLSH